MGVASGCGQWAWPRVGKTFLLVGDDKFDGWTESLLFHKRKEKINDKSKITTKYVTDIEVKPNLAPSRNDS